MPFQIDKISMSKDTHKREHGKWQDWMVTTIPHWDINVTIVLLSFFLSFFHTLSWTALNGQSSSRGELKNIELGRKGELNKYLNHSAHNNASGCTLLIVFERPIYLYLVYSIDFFLGMDEKHFHWKWVETIDVWYAIKWIRFRCIVCCVPKTRYTEIKIDH